ncbi:hypothetical protein BC833DRAFT_578666 [Globomyces pollinis-pini]|nr:hypothetical protein BC833DRAFT_578666 [Globomyces pollinis-pini]
MIPSLIHQNNINYNHYDIYSYLLSWPWKSIFQRVPAAFIILLFPFMLFAPIYSPFLYLFYSYLLHCLIGAQAIKTCYAVYSGYHLSKIHSTTNWLQKYCEDRGVLDGADLRHDLPYDSITHVIILPSYKEDLNTLCETLDILASHRRALTQYRVSSYQF